jgi:ubiquinone/menaquinone biosynthesis C-methylase UbiE
MAPVEEKQANQAVWGASPAGTTFGRGHEPGTREFFEAVLERRSSWEQPWLPEVVPFASFRGQRVLEVGCGAGYDAYAFLLNGADYTGIDITPENPERVRAHLGFYGLTPNVMEADAENLPFEDESFDVVFSNGVLMSTPDMPKAFREAFRVLRPGGAFYATIYNANSSFYRLNVVLIDHIAKGGWRKRSLTERRSMIEYTTSDQLPLVDVYTRKQLGRLLREVGFGHLDLKVRKMVASDMPAVPIVQRLWPHVPQPWLDTLGKRWGWYICFEAHKP